MHRPARRWLVASHAMLQGMTEAPVAALLWYLPLREAIDHLASVSRQLGLVPVTTTALIKEALR